LNQYFSVENGCVTNEVVYLDAINDGNCMIAQANAEMDADGNFLGKVVVSQRDVILEVELTEVDSLDVSLKQVISVAAGLIPFLEQDDASRALMGSKLQPEGVPLLSPEALLVETGFERKVAVDSRNAVSAIADGIFASVDAECIMVTEDGLMPKN
jgi:DNA-directed RNA polymerase subunit beta